jgi:hypothetical protein
MGQNGAARAEDTALSLCAITLARRVEAILSVAHVCFTVCVYYRMSAFVLCAAKLMLRKACGLHKFCCSGGCGQH